MRGYIDLSTMHVQVKTKSKIPLSNKQTPKQWTTMKNRSCYGKEGQ
jgi:hypothetical protein